LASFIESVRNVIIKAFQNGAIAPAPEVLETSRNWRYLVSFRTFTRDFLGRCRRVQSSIMVIIIAAEKNT